MYLQLPSSVDYVYTIWASRDICSITDIEPSSFMIILYIYILYIYLSIYMCACVSGYACLRDHIAK